MDELWADLHGGFFDSHVCEAVKLYLTREPPQTEPNISTAESIGLPRFVDPDEEPQTSFPPLLHSFLHTLLLLLDVLTNTARIPGELEEKGWAHEGDQVGSIREGHCNSPG